MSERKKVVLSTKVSIARTGSPSMRTTVPMVLAQVLGLEDGDRIDWVWDPGEESSSVSVRRSPSKK